MSWQAAAHVWALMPTCGLAQVPRLVLLRLAEYAKPDGTGACPSPRSLAADCGVTPRRVQQALAELQGKGFVVVEGRSRRYGSTLFRVVMDAKSISLTYAKSISQSGGIAKSGTRIAKWKGPDCEIAGASHICTDPIDPKRSGAAAAVAKSISLWEGVLSAMETRLSRREIRDFLRPLEVVGEDPQTIVVRAPQSHEGLAGVVSRHYLAQLREAAAAVREGLEVHLLDGQNTAGAPGRSELREGADGCKPSLPHIRVVSACASRT